MKIAKGGSADLAQELLALVEDKPDVALQRAKAVGWRVKDVASLRKKASNILREAWRATKPTHDSRPLGLNSPILIAARAHRDAAWPSSSAPKATCIMHGDGAATVMVGVQDGWSGYCVVDADGASALLSAGYGVGGHVPSANGKESALRCLLRHHQMNNVTTLFVRFDLFDRSIVAETGKPEVTSTARALRRLGLGEMSFVTRDGDQCAKVTLPDRLSEVARKHVDAALSVVRAIVARAEAKAPGFDDMVTQMNAFKSQVPSEQPQPLPTSMPPMVRTKLERIYARLHDRDAFVSFCKNWYSSAAALAIASDKHRARFEESGVLPRWTLIKALAERTKSMGLQMMSAPRRQLSDEAFRQLLSSGKILAIDRYFVGSVNAEGHPSFVHWAQLLFVLNAFEDPTTVLPLFGQPEYEPFWSPFFDNIFATTHPLNLRTVGEGLRCSVGAH